MEKKTKLWKYILISVLAVVLILGGAGIIIGKNYTKKEEEKKAVAPGNAEKYSVQKLSRKKESKLRGKNILFLGSSVTYGAASQGISFADYLGQIDGVNVTKEAVSATTLVDEFSVFAFLGSGNGDSYVTRLKNVDATTKFDAVVVQLSTNDATMEKTLGEICESTELNSFDTKTVTGAMEYIIGYSEKTWNCPVIFYTGTYYDSEAYSTMVERLIELQDKWAIGVIDLYNDEALNNISEETYDFYMFDEIHPTKAGYLEWWLPTIQNYLYDYLK